MSIRILLLEDEAALAEALQISIKKLGYECIWVKSLKEAKSVLKKSNPSEPQAPIWVLDRNVPDGDGIELLEHPARDGKMVLILSAKSSVQERVKGLRAGADDYLPKPFSFSELSARLEALERRIQKVREPWLDSTEPPKLWAIRQEQLSVFTPQGWVELTPLEFKVLVYLMERKGTIVSKDRLLKDVWGFRFLPKTRTVDYMVTQLRKRIEPNPEKPQHILTIRGAGIRFVA